MGSAREYEPGELAGMLSIAARGLYAVEAAVALVIEHQVWLARADFRDFITVEYDRAGGYAAVDWPTVIEALDGGELPCSRSEASMLRIAASLASSRATVNLGQAISGLDADNTRLVLAALAHANGYPSTEVRLA